MGLYKFLCVVMDSNGSVQVFIDRDVLLLVLIGPDASL